MSLEGREYIGSSGRSLDFENTIMYFHLSPHLFTGGGFFCLNIHLTHLLFDPVFWQMENYLFDTDFPAYRQAGPPSGHKESKNNINKFKVSNPK